VGDRNVGTTSPASEIEDTYFCLGASNRFSDQSRHAIIHSKGEPLAGSDESATDTGNLGSRSSFLGPVERGERFKACDDVE
jgi:hypothetical protein